MAILHGKASGLGVNKLSQFVILVTDTDLFPAHSFPVAFLFLVGVFISLGGYYE